MAARLRRRRSRFNLHLQEDPAWERRAQRAVQLLAACLAGTTLDPGPLAIADFGCGNERLAAVLAGSLGVPFTYQGYDFRPQSQRVVKLDVQDDMPDRRFDVVFALGLLEYLRDVGDFAARLRRVCRFAIVSYVIDEGRAPRPDRRRAVGWLSDYDRAELADLWKRHGWAARDFALLDNGDTGLWLWEDAHAAPSQPRA